jgi:CelD/BcsL family acetyltransferase involved in cellulose biosynthesis
MGKSAEIRISGLSVKAHSRARARDDSGLTVETITRAADLDALCTAYDQLNRASRLPVPFTLHEWHCAWCDHFLALTDTVEDSLLVYVVRSTAGQCVGIAPMVHTRRSVGPFKVSWLNLLGADKGLTEIRMPLVAPGFHAEVAHIVQRQLAMIVRKDWIQWGGVTTAFANGLAGSADLRWQRPLMDYVLDLPADWQTFRNGLKRNIRESLRHCYNSLKRENHSFYLVTLERPEEIQAGLDQFMRLHAMRAALAGTTTHYDRFASVSAQAFLRDVCARLAARNVTRVFQLVIDGQIVATRIGFVIGDTLYLYYSGFDTAWAKYSVMTTALAEIIKLAISQGLRTINLSPGTDIAKTRWGPREVPIGRLLQVDPRLRSKAACSVYEYATGSDSRARWIGKVLGSARRRWS